VTETTRPLAVIVANPAYDAHLASAEALLDSYFPLTGWAEAIRDAGAHPVVIQRFRHSGQLERHGVVYAFVDDDEPPFPRPWHAVPRLVSRVAAEARYRSARADADVVVHLNGLVFPRLAATLRRRLPERCALVVQHHAERPHGPPWRLAERWWLRRVDRFLFTSTEVALSWTRAGIVPVQKASEVLELSSALEAAGRDRARARTGMTGSPILLWTGNLDANKDPLAVLAGFERMLDRHPEARLYMAWRHAPLEREVTSHIARSSRLRAAVTSLGTLAYAEIADLYRSADLFVQGSHKEGSGVALLDAMACGAVPVVTDIAAFRRVTGEGRVGALWPVGDVDAFVEAVERVLSRPLAPQSAEVVREFEARLSWPAIAERAVATYRAAAAERRAGAP
jgi:glycosyltransferase involved in cell wall biosynthesis